MAVFPDRIVLKNSTDAQATIEAAIASGGSDPITQGEIVIGLTPSDAKFYTLDGSGNVVSLGGTTPGITALVEDLTPQLGGDLDVNGFNIGSASGGDVTIAPDTTGGFVVRGNSTDGSITLNCTANTHGVTIQAPPHSDAATYSLILPSSAGTAGQVLTSQGGAQLTWEDAASGGFADPMTTDGDIIIRSGGTTTRLGIGSESQVLTVSSGLPVWAAASGGGGTTISEAFSTDSGYIHEFTVGVSTDIGLIQAVGSELYINWIDANDRDTRVYVSQLELDGSTLYWSVDGATWTQYSYTTAAFLSAQARWYVSGGSTAGFPSSGTVYVAFVLAPQNGSLVSPDAIAAKDGTGWANSGILPRLSGADVSYSQTLRYDTFVADAPTAQGEIGTVPANTSYLRIYETDADGRRVDASKLRSNPTANSTGAPVVFLWVDGVKNRVEPINSTQQVGYQSNYYQFDTKQNINTLCSGASEIYVEIPSTPADSASLRWNESLSRWESDPTTARVTSSTVPSTNADAGYPGEMRHDATHLYVCVEEDTWKRVAWDGTF